MYFSFASIESLSYTSVLQRTFNLNITVSDPASADQKPQEVEFSMIDQADYSGIDSYVKKHSLNDASMAAQRRAQRYNVNGPVKGEDGEDAAAEGEEDGETELQKAQQMLEDAEDEEEEDYDPGSEGESEGEGSSSSEEEEYDDDGQEQDEDGNILEDELGSEAEEVEMSDQE